MIWPAGWTVTARRAPAERLTPLSQRSIDSGWVGAAPTSALRLPFVPVFSGKIKEVFYSADTAQIGGQSGARTHSLMELKVVE